MARRANRWSNSVALFKASWGVLRNDRKLAVLPIASGIACGLVGLSFALPIAALMEDGGTNAAGTESTGGGAALWVLLAVGYVLLAFVGIFFNAALVFAADKRLRGEEVTLGEALRSAGSKIHLLLPWAIVSATVSMILRAIEERAGVLGTIAAGIAGVAWSVATFLVMPILVFEGLGPIAAAKRSGRLCKDTWGENIIANGGIGLVGFVGMLVGIIPMMLLAAAGGGGPLTVIAIVLLVAWVATVLVVCNTLTGILQTALYHFARDGEAVGFDEAQMTAMFTERRA